MLIKIREIAYKYAFVLIIFGAILPFFIKVEPYEVKKEEVPAPTVVYVKHEEVMDAPEVAVVEEKFDLHEYVLGLLFETDFKLYKTRESDNELILELITKNKTLENFDKEVVDNIAMTINPYVEKELIIIVTNESDYERVMYTTRIS